MDHAADGEEALFMSGSVEYDLIILDLMLPRVGGLDVVKKLRANGKITPVLILTARDEKESVVSLLNAGADDYMAKPFDLGELLARAKASVRRGKGQRRRCFPSRICEAGYDARALCGGAAERSR